MMENEGKGRERESSEGDIDQFISVCVSITCPVFLLSAMGPKNSNFPEESFT